MSVIAAVFNEEVHIQRLLRSLAGQSLPPLEVIVVDDGSTDRTVELTEGFDVKLVRLPHRGPARARNVGVRLARGGIVVFVDGDMACHPRFLEALVAPIARGDACGSFSKEIYVGNAENDWAHAYARIRRLAFPRLLPETFPERWANYRAIRRDAFVDAGGYDDVGYGEDMTLAPKVGELAVAAPGAICEHFNPATPSEIFDNARWIARGHDIQQVAHPWRDSFIGRALVKGISESRSAPGAIMIAARLAYHAGLTLGLVERKLSPWRHWK